MTGKIQRVHFYIDAFNVWHRIKDHRQSGGKDYRWLDYARVCRSIVLGNKQLFEGGELGNVALFTARAPEWWDENKRARHQTLVRALRKTGAEVVDRGYFKRTRETMRDEQTDEALLSRRGAIIKRTRVTEKQTDTSIVARMVGDSARASARGELNLYMAVSGDNDIAPALDEVQSFGQYAGVVLPPSRQYRRDKNLENAASTNNGGAALIVRIRFKNFDGCCLPQNPGNDEQGEIIMPEGYGKF